MGEYCTSAISLIVRKLVYIPISMAMHIISVSMQYVPSQIAFGFLYCVFVLFIRSSLFSDSFKSLSNHSCSDTPGLLVLLPTLAIIFSQLSLVVTIRMVATVHAYYNVQYGRILHSCSVEQ